jgi:exodeoxyribonuclease VII large subunit
LALQASQLGGLNLRLRHAAQRQFSTHSQQVQRAKSHLRAPDLNPLRQHLSGLTRHLAAASAKNMSQRFSNLTALSASLQALSPQRVLERGYAVVLDAQGKAVLSPQAAGSAVTLKLAHGEQAATVH